MIGLIILLLGVFWMFFNLAALFFCYGGVYRPFPYILGLIAIIVGGILLLLGI